MAGIFHTVALPLRRYAGQALSWQSQDPTTIRTCRLDCSAWLKDAGTTIASASVLADATIQTGGFGFDSKTVWLTIQGGTPNTYPVVSFRLVLADGNRENVNVIAPIINLHPVIPDDAVTVGGQAVTAAFRPIEITQMPPIEGGAEANDLLLLVRPGQDAVVGSTSFASLFSRANGANVPMLAGANINGHRALMFDDTGAVVHADPSQYYSFAGISTQAASAGTSVLVAVTGLLVEPSWSWQAHDTIFVGLNGVLSTQPPLAGIVQQIAVSAGPTALLIQPNPSILLN